MKILAVSDRVLEQLYVGHIKEKFPDVGLIVGCGDLPFYYLEFLVSALDVPLVYVRGNHDKGPQYMADGRSLESVQGGVELHGKVVEIEGLLMMGLEGSMRYHPNAPLMYSEWEMRWQVLRLIPKLFLNRLFYGRYLDILITHSPPFGIHDLPDLPHTGFKIFLRFMHWFKPRYLLHGHVHVYRQDVPTVTQFEATTIINVYPYRAFNVGDFPVN